MSIKFNENYLGYKSKLILLSAICLFIALSKALPQEIKLLGLDLSGNSTVIGWFLVAATSYFFVLTFILGILDILKYKKPSIVNRLSKNLTGNTLGLTEQECFQDEYQTQSLSPDQERVGTTGQELQDIQHQRSRIDNKVTNYLQTAYDWLIISFYFLLPVVLYMISQCYLIRLLLCISNNKI